MHTANMFGSVLAGLLLLVSCGHCQERGRVLGKTKIINTKQGQIQGLIVEPKYNQNLNNVQVFLGIPYAAPPVGSQRFMPPASPPQWPGLFIANTLSPVCPQHLPDFSAEAQRKMPAGRYEYLARLLPYLKNQSEDCLYLNIYAPERTNVYESPKLPVIVFIHGESFQWNSGNPYDGSVLAGYGNVIVVTINFRLGILGFLRPGVGDHTPSNFGLLDQLAALQWIKDNIAAFDGDEDSVTLMGHGTGAACVNYLMVSPVSQGATGLFHRAIMMSGTALADWALTSNPIQFTIQVAEALNCPESSDEMANCLRRKRLNEIMAVNVHAPPFRTPFGPVIDGTVVPNEPAKLMTIYKDLFLRYEMLYGMTETESYHLLDAISLANGMLEEDSTQLLKDYFRAKYEVLPDVAMAKTLRQYNMWYMGPSMSAAEEHRDKVLEILSDARVAAPLVQTATYHSQANPKSYFYVFKHRSKYGSYPSISRSVHGEELPYIFGVPLDGASFPFHSNYNLPERLLSEVIMTLWCNFAKHGNPNIHRRREYRTQGLREWQQYDIEWPEYNTATQPYYSLGVPPSIGHFYRRDMMTYWNHQLPEQLKNPSPYEPPVKIIPPTWMTSEPPRKSTYPIKPMPPIFRQDPETDLWNPRYRIPYVKTPRPTEEPYYGSYQNGKLFHLSHRPEQTENVQDGPKDKLEKQEKTSRHETEPEETGDDELANAPSVALSIVILVGICFLIINVCAFIGLYYQRDKLKVRERIFNPKYTCDGRSAEEDLDDRYVKKDDAGPFELSRDLKNTEIKSILKSSEGIYEPVKATSLKTESSGGGSRKPHRWAGISRQASSSTMTVDPHTKVREWIAQEIVHKCSPRFLRRNKKLELKNDSTDTYVDQISSNTMDSNVSRIGTLQKPKVKKVSVAVDATPATRSASILQQTPIELTKSLDDGKTSSGLGSVKASTSMVTILKRPSLQRSDALTTDEYDDSKLRKSSTSINLKLSKSTESVPTVVHYHSASDPTTSASSDVISGISKINYIHLSKEKVGTEPLYSEVKKPKKGDSNTTLESYKDMDVNVTSRDDLARRSQHHTAEDALDHIKRRNFPKVLPDLPDNSEFSLQKAMKRRSLPLSTLLSTAEPNEEDDEVLNELPTLKVPPPPPPRVSTLGRKPTNTTPLNATHISVRLKTSDTKTQLPGPKKSTNVPTLPSPIRPAPPQRQEAAPQTTPMKRLEPKIIIKPTSVTPVTKHDNKGHSNIPRVTHHVPPPENPNKGSTRDVPSTSTKAAVPSTSKIPEMGIGKRTKINPVKKTVSTETSSTDYSIPNTGTIKKAKK